MQEEFWVGSLEKSGVGSTREQLAPAIRAKWLLFVVVLNLSNVNN
jgi:hypothetical protein